MTQQTLYTFQEGQKAFVAQNAFHFKTIYFPLCGIDEAGIKSAITPYLSGDLKIDQYRYITKPASTEDLRQPVRNFFLYLSDKHVVSLAQTQTDDTSHVEAGLLWHKQIRSFASAGIETQTLNFVPVSGEHAELMQVQIKNTSSRDISFVPTGAVPLFGRSLANKHDHEHVTSLLHRIKQDKQGVMVTPTMVFNEEGHLANEQTYFVFGFEEDGSAPTGTFPTVESFFGTQGDLRVPEAVMKNLQPTELSSEALHGREAVGALRFQERTLAPGETCTYYLLIGTAEHPDAVQKTYQAFQTPEAFSQALGDNQAYWQEKSQAIQFQTGDPTFNQWMPWVVLQPVLRRIYGCSFLPDHDYGKGGKGWRDIWQDLLSLILIEPDQVRDDLFHNFGGVRIDGSNATIIGSRPGEFIADRNDITRVWMDHGAWPLLTLALYIDQTGDLALLSDKMTYFRDKQLSRNERHDEQWNEVYGNKLKCLNGDVYKGSVLEHVILQTLIPFFNVGEHNHFRLESADWNDGLDMAFDRGESVTFGAFYAGNLMILVRLLEHMKRHSGQTHVSLAKEIGVLFSFLNHQLKYDHAEAKKRVLFDLYFPSVEPEISGEKLDIAIDDLMDDFKSKAEWVFHHIRQTELLDVNGHRWFNGYYDNQAQRVEGRAAGDRVRMTLTGQVFPIMSGCAHTSEVQEVVEAVNTYLKDPKWKGYRLNTDFGLKHYLELGRAFGFAYGTKENGAFFSHMTVMYANALYARGFARDGFEVLNSIYQMSSDSMNSKIYPGVPEYIDSQGRGMYHYLTGSASWFVLTMVTQVFGIKGDIGDLVLSPQLVAEQFDDRGQASITAHFAGRTLTFMYQNPGKKDAGGYKVTSVEAEGSALPWTDAGPGGVKIERKHLSALKSGSSLTIQLA